MNEKRWVSQPVLKGFVFWGAGFNLPPDSGETLTFTDTLLARTDSTYCWQKLIITHTIFNYGSKQLPDILFTRFFM